MEQLTSQGHAANDLQASNASVNMGVEDYLLGRVNRRDEAPHPSAYQDGWDQAARQEQYEADAERIAGL